MMPKLAFCLNAPGYCEFHSQQETVKIYLGIGQPTAFAWQTTMNFYYFTTKSVELGFTIITVQLSLA